MWDRGDLTAGRTIGPAILLLVIVFGAIGTLNLAAILLSFLS